MANNRDLIENLIKDGYLKASEIIEAFKKIDRKDFMPEDMKESAYLNEAQPIGERQTISQPLVVAFMLELLAIKPGEKVLEIGTGSGWQTALMAQILTQKKADNFEPLISIERIESLHNFAKANISKYGFLERNEIKLVLADGSLGYGESAPYDKIIAAAAALEMPEVWKEQLKIGGRIVAPVKESIIVIDKITKDNIETKEYMGFSFVPLVKG